MGIIIEDAFQSKVGDRFYLNVTACVKSIGSKSSKRRPILFIVDRSGSMSGSSFNNLKRVIRDNFATVTKDGPIIFFNHGTSKVKTLNQFESIDATGGTSFSEAFKCAMNELSLSNVWKNVDVLFLTDGQDGSYTTGADDSFQSTVQSLDGRVHVIGYGRDHDLNRMMKLVGPKNLNNTYQYCKDATELEQTILNVVSFNSSIEIKFDYKDIKVDLFQSEDDPKIYIGRSQIPKLMDDGFILKLNQTGQEVRVETKQPGILEEIESIENRIDECQSNLKQHHKSIDSCIEQVTSRFQQMVSSQSIAHRERKQILTALMKLKQKFNDALANYTKTDSFTQKAMNFAQSRAIPSRRMNNIRSKKLIEVDDIAINECEKMTKIASSALNQPSTIFDALPQNLDPCELSLSSAIDLAKDGDCLGVTVQISRPDVTMVIPSLVQIQHFAPHTLSFSMFRDLVSSATTESDYNQVASIMRKDRYFSTAFNSVLPLYVNEQHWSVAKHYWPVACGWIVGLDERLGEWGMVGPVICSFAYWYWMNSDSSMNSDSQSTEQKNEKQSELERMVWETMIHLSKEPKCEEYINNLFDKFNQGLINKTEIPNLRSYIGAMHLMNHELSQETIDVLCLEVLRRKFGSALESKQQVWAELARIFIDVEDPYSIDRTSFWKMSVELKKGVEPSDFDFNKRTAYVAWAMMNCWDDKIDGWTCDHSTFLNDIESQLSEIHQKVRNHIREAQERKDCRTAAYDSAVEYIEGNDETFTFEKKKISHIYEGSYLHDVLVCARSRKKSQIPKAREKLRFLRKNCGVLLSNQNKKAFK